MGAPEGFTEHEWQALGSHTCPRTNPGCKCRVHYGQADKPYLTSIRVLEPDPEPVINRNPAPPPWVPRASRHEQFRRAA